MRIDEIGRLDDVPYKTRLIADGHARRLFERLAGCPGMRDRTDAADALGDLRGVPRVPVAHHVFQAAVRHA